MVVDINQIKRNLLIGYPLFGTLISNVIFVSSSEVETAATNGKYIFYNENYFKTLTKSEQTFLLAHEICHIAFKHMQRSDGKNLEAWNIATDAVINALLVNDGLTMPEGMVYIEDAINYNCEELYEMLLKDNSFASSHPSNHDLWKKENRLVGQVIEAVTPNGQKHVGVFKDILPDGAMILEENGVEFRFDCGDIKLDTKRIDFKQFEL